jgi:NADPH2 dehydrogenase
MSRLFTPLIVGDVKLDHRVAMAPLTRYRMDDDFKATPMSKGIRTAIVAKERF